MTILEDEVRLRDNAWLLRNVNSHTQVYSKVWKSRWLRATDTATVRQQAYVIEYGPVYLPDHRPALFAHSHRPAAFTTRSFGGSRGYSLPWFASREEQHQSPPSKKNCSSLLKRYPSS